MKFRRGSKYQLKSPAVFNPEYQVGYRALTRGIDSKDILIYSFQSHSSIGRVCSQIIKHMIINQRTNPKKVYLIENPETLTFSSGVDFLVNKYKLKFHAGGKSKGPFYKKSVFGIFKLILRTMMKHKQKHKDMYKKICVLMEPHTHTSEKVKISVRSSKYNQTTMLSELVKKI
jgi:ribosomal protein L13